VGRALLKELATALDRAYLDKLDGKIDAEFWERKSVEWRAEERQVMMALAGLDQARPRSAAQRLAHFRMRLVR